MCHLLEVAGRTCKRINAPLALRLHNVTQAAFNARDGALEGTVRTRFAVRAVTAPLPAAHVSSDRYLGPFVATPTVLEA